MNGSNSFNICPRCGNSNALNAKYCSRCGAQLKVPEEPVVCHKCHTRNTPMANFCRNCGATLKVGSATKICPKCGKEVDANDNVCVCGYSFVTMQQTMPASAPVESVESNVVPATSEVTVSKKVYNTKGGRGWAIAALFLILLFAYYIIAPLSLSIKGKDIPLRPAFDKGFVTNADGVLYGVGFISMLIGAVKDIVGGAQVGATLKGLGVGNVMIIVLVAIFIITACVHFLVAFIRCFTTKRSKHMNWYFLIMAILSTLVIGLITLFAYVHPSKDFMVKVASWFSLGGSSIGFAIWALPLYFWFFYLYSLGAKAKVLKEQAA